MENKDALEIAKESYTHYGKEVGMNRVYPSIYDGMKPSYRRAIYGMWQGAPRHKVKVAELASHALKWHPHPTAIEGVIVSMGNGGNKLSLMDTKGQWGNWKLGIGAAASRYIGGMISDFALNLLCDSVEYTPFVKGEIDVDEPMALPALIPLCFINGLKGVPSGLPTVNIPELNVEMIIDYYIEILKKKDLNHKPSWFPIPNCECDVITTLKEWDEIMKCGKGSLRVGPTLHWEDNAIIIDAIPDKKGIEHIYGILSNEISSDKIYISDETTSRFKVKIEKVPKKWLDMNEIYNRLYSKLQCSVPYNFAFYDENKIYVPCGFDFVVKKNLEYLIKTHNNRMEHQLIDANLKLKVLQIIEDLKSTNRIHDMIMMSQEEAISYIETTYSVEQSLASKVLQKPISYLTRAHESEIKELEDWIKSLENDKSDIFDYLLRKYKSLKKEVSKLTSEKYLPSRFVNG